MADALSCAILDGFTVDASWLYQTNYLQPYAISRLEALRRAPGFVPRYFVAPQSSQLPIPQNGTTFLSIRMKPGTILWGLLFYIGGNVDYYIQIGETNGRNLFAEPISVGSSPGLLYIVEPFTVASGELNVTIANGGAAETDPMPGQLVLLCAEPATAETECP